MAASLGIITESSRGQVSVVELQPEKHHCLCLFLRFVHGTWRLWMSVHGCLCVAGIQKNDVLRHPTRTSRIHEVVEGALHTREEDCGFRTAH
jgi:hypothetical protein